MSALSERLTRQHRRHRQGAGTDVVYGGLTYRVMSASVSGSDAGTQTLPVQTLGVYIASADPRMFNFSPQDFQPWTEIEPPREGQEIIWHGLLYQISAVTYLDVGDHTVSIQCYANREVA